MSNLRSIDNPVEGGCLEDRGRRVVERLLVRFLLVVDLPLVAVLLLRLGDRDFLGGDLVDLVDLRLAIGRFY